MDATLRRWGSATVRFGFRPQLHEGAETDAHHLWSPVAGLVPATHVFAVRSVERKEGVDAHGSSPRAEGQRGKPCQDEIGETISRPSSPQKPLGRGRTMRVARLSCANWRNHSLHVGCAAASSAVKKPSQESASCSSSASRGSGRCSSRTRSMAAESSAPRSFAVDGSLARREYTACDRRSSSGASSRNA